MMDAMRDVAASSPSATDADLGLDPDGFSHAASAAWTQFFEHLLPRYIHRHYRGKGCYLLHKLVADLDADRFEPLDPPPAAWAVRRARFAAANLSFVVDDRVRHQGPGVVVLGLFEHRAEYQVSEFQTKGQHWRTLYLYRGSFRALGLRDREAVYAQILHTIAHEFVHYLESFLPEEDRTLANRERGVFQRSGLPEPTLDEARRRDTRYAVRWWVVCAALTAVALALFGVIVAGAA